MDIVPGPYTDNRSVADNQIETLGHPGKYYASTTVVAGTQVDFTGSNFGYSAVLLSGSYNGTLTLTGGGTIAGGNLSTGVIYDLSVIKAAGGSTGGVYVIRKGF